MSALFSVKGDGRVLGVSLDDIYKYPIYRQIERHKIPLNIGTCQDGEKIVLMLYHEHVNMNAV